MPVLSNLGGSLTNAVNNLRQGAGNSLLNKADRVVPGLKNAVLSGDRQAGTKAASAIRASSSSTVDWRCKLIWRGVSDLSGASGPLTILPKSGSDVVVVWPYTPQFQINYQASYDMIRTLQTNFATPAYQSSDIQSITINGEFTATTSSEANYLYAVIHFLKSATKGFGWESTDRTGLPPPVLTLKYLGDGSINSMPVVVTTFNVDYPKDVDYIKTDFAGSSTENLKESMVPSEMTISVSLTPAYSRGKMKDAKYSTTEFIKGNLLDKGFF